MQFAHVPLLQPGMAGTAEQLDAGHRDGPGEWRHDSAPGRRPDSPPLIDPRYLTEAHDRHRLVRGLDTARVIVADGALTSGEEPSCIPVPPRP
jgi:hypothetical protein